MSSENKGVRLGLVGFPWQAVSPEKLKDMIKVSCTECLRTGIFVTPGMLDEIKKFPPDKVVIGCVPCFLKMHLETGFFNDSDSQDNGLEIGTKEEFLELVKNINVVFYSK